MTVVIRSFFYQITISNESFAIFTNEYYLNDNGEEVEFGIGDVYEYGDIIIRTPSTNYIIKRVYAAFDYVVRILEEIKEHCQDPVIYIDMEKLNKFWPDHSVDSELIVEPLR